MKKPTRRPAGGAVAVCLVGLCLATASAPRDARGQEVTVTGSTTGIVTGAPQLTFTGSSFTGTTALGVGALSGSNGLGSFFLSTAPTQAIAGTFTLNISFTSPSGIAGGQGAAYLATVVGSVSPNIDQGGVSVTFPQATQAFTFNNGIESGAFSLTLADVFVQTGRSASLTAGINSLPIPEPTTLPLLGAGLAAVAAARRRPPRSSRGNG